MGSDGQPTVIYVAGMGRSGSTLLERILGSLPGFSNVGELIDLFPRVYPRDERCGCGASFGACPFWTEVGDRAFGGWSPRLAQEMTELQGRVARQRWVPRLLRHRADSSFARDLHRYGHTYRSLYLAIAATSGDSVVVDASKRPAQALALSQQPLDVRVAHMVRDIRGVAWSLSKRRVERPHVTQGSERMYGAGAFRAGVQWLACETQVGLLRHAGLPAATLHYDDLVRQARQSVERVLGELEAPLAPGSLDHVGADVVDLPSSHGLSGNPTRFHTGEVRLRPDDEWRRLMPVGQQRVLAALQGVGRVGAGARGPESWAAPVGPRGVRP